jgi:hypothetical protein
MQGVLFMEGAGEPAELIEMRSNLRALAAGAERSGVWLREAMCFEPQRVRADLSGARTTAGFLYSAAELLDRAVDLLVTSTTLTRDSERSWRTWSERVDTLSECASPWSEPVPTAR